MWQFQYVCVLTKTLRNTVSLVKNPKSLGINSLDQTKGLSGLLSCFQKWLVDCSYGKNTSGVYME